MKLRKNPFLRSNALILAGFIAVLFGGPSAQAASLYWDTDGTTPGFGTASGTWGTDAFWNTDAAGGAGTFSNATATTDTINFGNGATGLGAGAIAVGTVSSGDMTFASGSGNIALTGGTITLAAAATIAVNNASDSISSILSGAGTSLTKNGTGTLTLSGANTYTGATTISAGTLSLTGSNTGNGAITFNNTGATLSFNSAAALGTGAISSTVTNTTNTLTTAGASGITLASTNTLSLSNPTAFIINGTQALTFAGAFTQTSGGAPILTVSNTGGTTFNGTFALNAGAGSGLIINGTANTTIGGVLSGAKALTYSGSGILTLSGANTYTGNTTLTGGTLNITNAANTTTGVFSIAAGSTLNLASFSDYGVASAMGSRLAASETNSATDSATTGIGLRFRGGTLQYTGSTAQSTNRQIRLRNVATNTIDASGSGSGTLSFTYNGTNTNLFETGGARTLNLIGSNTGANTFAIGLTDQATNLTSLTKSGTGTWVLTGANTYTGRTTVNAGTLLLDMTGTGALASTSTLTLGGGNFSIRGKTTGTTAQTLASLSLSAGTGSSITLNPNGGTSTTLTITSSTVTAGAGAALNFNYSAGTTNGTTVGNDVVAFTTAPMLSNGLLGGGYTVTDVGGSGFATVNGSNQVVRLTDPGSAGLPVTMGSSTSNYFINSNYSTVSTTTPGSLVEALSGGVAANSVTVDTTGLASGANLDLGANALTLTAGGGMHFSGANPYTITGSVGITSSASGAITFNNYVTSVAGLTISAPITDVTATAVTFAGTGKTVLSGANTYTGATTINAGTVQLGSSTNGGNTAGPLGVGSALSLGAAGTLDLRGFSATVGSLATATGTITDTSSAGSGGILQISNSLGGGNATLVTGSAGVQVQNNNGGSLLTNTANTYSGGTYLGIGTSNARWIPSGTAGSGSPGALTNGIFGTGTIYIGKTTADQSTIYLVGAATVNNAITYNSQLGTDTGGAVRVDATGVTFAGIQTAGATAMTFAPYSGGTLTITGQMTGSGTFTGTTSASFYGTGYAIGTNAGLIIGSSTGNGIGIATVILNNASGNNNYSGDTYVTASGILQTNAASQLPSGAGTGNLYLDGKFNLQGNSQAIGLLSGSGTVDGISGTPILTIGGNNATGLTFSGVIKNTAGTLALTKTGSGTQTLSGANTYTGNTTVSAGTLSLSSAYLANASTLTIATGATLNLNYTGTDIVASLSLGGSVQTTGTFDSTNSGGLITGNGKIQVGAGTANYASWATANGINGEPSAGDFDKDGLSNLVEYSLGLNPTTSSVPAGTFIGGVQSFTKGSEAFANGDVTYEIEASTTLETWSVVVPNNAAQSTISYTLPTGLPKTFSRLKVTQIP